jgi:nicotinamidase-related amidase
MPGDHRDEPGRFTLNRMPETAVLVIDMLNPYGHEDAEPLADSVRKALPAIVDLRDRAREAPDDVLTVYVNDNYEEWEAERSDLIEQALAGRHPELVEPIAPDGDVPFVFKGRHSIFYETPVAHLLNRQEIKRIVLTGQVTEQCILYSALDAYLRGYEVAVPRDAVAHIHPDLAEAALKMMETNMHADLTPVAEGGGFRPTRA